MKDGPKKDNKEKRPREHPLEMLAAYSRLFVGYFFVFTFIVGWFEIPSSSMEETLLIGDHVMVNREQFVPPAHWVGPMIPYGEVHRGDVLVFLSPAQPELYLVKRIVGLPGDRLHLQGGALYRNGQKLVEPYVIHSAGNYDPYRDDFPSVAPSEFSDVTDSWEQSMPQHVQNGDLVVPPGNYFAMGDNRDVSRDSRFWGFVPKENIIGRPMFIYWSFETPAGQYLQTGMGDRLINLVHTVVHFFDETRWRRTFRMVH